MSLSVGDLQVTTYNPAPGFDPLTADDADLVKNGFPPRQKNPELQARYEQILNQLKGRLHYIPATVRQRDEISHGPRQRLASAGTETSTNWSGGVVFAPTGQSFYCVEGDWVVPDIDAPTENQWYFAASWIGIDGDASGDVCQAGIESQVYRSGTSVVKQFYAWWEWYPLPEMMITNFPVGPGDMITALLIASPGAGATSATIYLTNRTSGAATSVTFHAPGGTTLVGNSAEWIVEAPTVSGGQSTMADFGEVFFSVCVAGTNKSATVDGGTGDTINYVYSTGATGAEATDISSTVIQDLYAGPLP